MKSRVIGVYIKLSRGIDASESIADFAVST